MFLFLLCKDLGELAYVVSCQVLAPENDWTWLVRPLWYNNELLTRSFLSGLEWR